jgi:proteasome assembly chaperone (PAC2) family protein
MDKIRIDSRPDLSGGRLVLAFTGWMDGGEVSTGTVKGLIDEFGAEPFAEVDPEGFYVCSFPGDPQTSALVRPHIKVRDGLVESVELPSSRFYCAEDRKLAFFVGKEPHLNWRQFADCVLEFAAELGIESMYFVGSFTGSVPHTREPRLHLLVSHESLKEPLLRFGFRPTNYEGPGSFMTYFNTRASERDLSMVNIVAEIPAYLGGTNPSSIEAVTRRLAAMLEIEVDLSRLRQASNKWEATVSEAIGEEAEMAEHIRELEKQYDDDLLESTSKDGLVPGLDGFLTREEELPEASDEPGEV